MGDDCDGAELFAFWYHRSERAIMTAASCSLDSIWGDFRKTESIWATTRGSVVDSLRIAASRVDKRKLHTAVLHGRTSNTRNESEADLALKVLKAADLQFELLQNNFDVCVERGRKNILDMWSEHANEPKDDLVLECAMRDVQSMVTTAERYAADALMIRLMLDDINLKDPSNFFHTELYSESLNSRAVALEATVPHSKREAR